MLLVHISAFTTLFNPSACPLSNFAKYPANSANAYRHVICTTLPTPTPILWDDIKLK